MNTYSCAKQRVVYVIVNEDGSVAGVGENRCQHPVAKCPRIGDDGYDKCTAVCGQITHAEVAAVWDAGSNIKPGAGAFIHGHSYACDSCKAALKEAGVSVIIIASGGKNREVWL